MFIYKLILTFVSTKKKFSSVFKKIQALKLKVK